jgi:hypothetical protein
VRALTSALAVALAASAAAQEPPPSPSTASPTAPATPPPPATPTPTAPATPPTTAPPTARPWRPGAELILSGWGGSRAGRGSSATGGGADLVLLIFGDVMALGPRISAEKIGDGVGLGVGLAAGPRIPLARWARLDVLADGGFAWFGRGQHQDCELFSCTTASSTRTTLPTFGLRAGVALLPGDGWVSLTLGVFARFVREQDVAYTSQTCTNFLFSGCSAPRTEHEHFGGRLFGAFLALGYARRFGPP